MKCLYLGCDCKHSPEYNPSAQVPCTQKMTTNHNEVLDCKQKIAYRLLQQMQQCLLIAMWLKPWSITSGRSPSQEVNCTTIATSGSTLVCPLKWLLSCGIGSRWSPTLMVCTQKMSSGHYISFSRTQLKMLGPNSASVEKPHIDNVCGKWSNV